MGLFWTKALQGVEEAGALEVFEEGGGLAAGDDEAVEICEIFGLADEDGGRAELAQHGGVGFVGALQGEDADGGGTHVCLGGRRFNIHFAEYTCG